MQKKYNRFKNSKLKLQKKRMKKIKEERKKENSTELQEPNIDIEVYNNKKCD